MPPSPPGEGFEERFLFSLYYTDEAILGSEYPVSRRRKKDDDAIAFIMGIGLIYVFVKAFEHWKTVLVIIIICAVFIFLGLYVKNQLKKEKQEADYLRLVQIAEDMRDVDNMDGHEFEYFCAGLLVNDGFRNIEVTRGSGDQGVDIIAHKDGIKYAIQCKRYSGNLGNKPVQEVNTGKALYNCSGAIVMSNSHFTKGAVTAAEATGVLLWDRDKLSSLMHVKQIGD